MIQRIIDIWRHRVVKAPPQVKYVSWYQQPWRHVPREYLCESAFGAAEGGYYYSRDLADAHRFDTHEAAMAVTPRYDGSDGIEDRTGVIEVPA